jgi:hypothetical protein
MTPYVITALLLGSGIYVLLLGMGKKLWPPNLRTHEETRLAGRALLFLGALSLPACFGASYHQIGEWLEDIWTTGGGGGTG